MKVLYLVVYPWICSSVSWFTVYGNLNSICILLLCENCINLNYLELVHCAFQVYYILLRLYIFILLIFESLILKLQLKILIYLLKKIIAIYSGTVCSSVLYFPRLLEMCYDTFIILKKEQQRRNDHPRSNV